MAYAASLAGGWVYEDLPVSSDQVPIYFTALSWRVGGYWMTHQSYAVTTAVFGASATAARTVSLAWHLLNGLLLWSVIRRAVPASTAVLAVGLFLLWPIQTEAVAAVAYRSEVVAATWLLIACLCAQLGGGWFVLAWICAVGAVTGKPVGILALALVPMLTARLGTPWARRHLAMWALACVWPLCLVIEWFIDHRVPLWQTPEAMAVNVAIVGRLVALGLWSVINPGVLSIDHDWRALTPVMGVATAAGALLLVWLWTGWARFAVIWIAVALSLRIVWVLPEIHEHHLYTAWVAVSLAIAHVVTGGMLWQDRTNPTPFRNTRARSTVQTARLAPS